MDEADVVLRNLTYGLFVELGRAPTLHEIADRNGATPDDVWAGWQRLHDDHALVLQAHTRELRMANPFSAVPTAYRVFADDRWWYANCAWDAFGVCAALHVDGRIDTSCADCGEPITVHVRNEQPDGGGLLFHCVVPAVRWWDDIVFT
jgi:hypothetical protein